MDEDFVVGDVGFEFEQVGAVFGVVDGALVVRTGEATDSVVGVPRNSKCAASPSMRRRK